MIHVQTKHGKGLIRNSEEIVNGKILATLPDGVKILLNPAETVVFKRDGENGHVELCNEYFSKPKTKKPC